MNNRERLEKLNIINNLIFEIENSYPHSYTNPHPIRQKLYHTRIELGTAEWKVKQQRELEIEIEREK